MFLALVDSGGAVIGPGGSKSSDLLTSGIASLARQEAYFFVRPQVTSV